MPNWRVDEHVAEAYWSMILCVLQSESVHVSMTGEGEVGGDCRNIAARDTHVE